MRQKLFGLGVYTGFAVIVWLAVWWGLTIQRRISMQAITEFDFYPFVQFTVWYSLGLGLLLATPYLWKEFKKVGVWMIHRVKLIVWSLPMLLLTFYPLLYFQEGSFLEVVLTKSVGMVFYELNGFLPGIIAVYTMATSFQKRSVKASC